MRRLLPILLLALASGEIRAADEAAPAVPSAAEGEKSSRMMRDPFWPVGYRPTQSSGATESRAPSPEKGTDPVHFSSLSPEEQAMIRRSMVVGGVLRLGTSYIAYINNSVVRAGELLRLDAGGRSYVFRVRSISENRVELEPFTPEDGQKTESP